MANVKFVNSTVQGGTAAQYIQPPTIPILKVDPEYEYKFKLEVCILGFKTLEWELGLWKK